MDSKMITTSWKLIEGGARRMRVCYGMQKLAGNQYAYFSITGEIQEARRSKFSEDSFGCLHDEIARFFPELAFLIPWHLVDETGTPMHYAANALHWLGIANHAIPAKELPQQAFDHFKHTVIWGSLPDDNSSEIPSLREAMPSLREADAWLAARLPRLQEAFKMTMQSAGLM